jgi:hypothetical protein
MAERRVSRMRMMRFACSFLLLCICAAHSFAAPRSGNDLVKAELLADVTAIEPGKDALASLRGRIHGYEALLQSEMKTLGRGMTHPGQWLASGVRGLLRQCAHRIH